MTEENLDLMCWKCRLEMTQEEFQESTDEEAVVIGIQGMWKTAVCRKCTARENRLRDFWDHMQDDEYWNSGKVPAWEWCANRIVLDAEDSAIFLHDLNLMEQEKLSTEDYHKIIEVLRDAFLWAKYDDGAFELPR